MIYLWLFYGDARWLPDNGIDMGVLNDYPRKHKPFELLS